ncbi:MAG: peptide chain release factor N(5)-glutamine methyltransferase [Hyphomonadaceae bacterium]
MTTLVSAWTAARNALRDAGIDTPALDARMLVELATGATRLDIVTDPYREVDAAALARLNALLARRAGREPVSHIVGYKDFWTHRFAVTPAVLTPRPETELLVQAALDWTPIELPRRVLDLGVGSGAILLTVLAARPLASGVGVDLSAEALAVAAANAETLGVGARALLVQDDWGAGLEAESFDVVLSNPPYIRTGALQLLEPEVGRHEPHLALDGGPDGLDGYRAALAAAARLLRPGGMFALELGQGQAEAVWALADDIRLQPDSVRDDLAGIPRALIGHKA